MLPSLAFLNVSIDAPYTAADAKKKLKPRWKLIAGEDEPARAPEDVLGVPYGTSDQEVKSVVRKLQLAWHPDKWMSAGTTTEHQEQINKQSAAVFREIQDASAKYIPRTPPASRRARHATAATDDGDEPFVHVPPVPHVPPVKPFFPTEYSHQLNALARRLRQLRPTNQIDLIDPSRRLEQYDAMYTAQSSQIKMDLAARNKHAPCVTIMIIKPYTQHQVQDWAQKPLVLGRDGTSVTANLTAYNIRVHPQQWDVWGTLWDVWGAYKQNQIQAEELLTFFLLRFDVEIELWSEWRTTALLHEGLGDGMDRGLHSVKHIGTGEVFTLTFVTKRPDIGMVCNTTVHIIQNSSSCWQQMGVHVEIRPQTAQSDGLFRRMLKGVRNSM